MGTGKWGRRLNKKFAANAANFLLRHGPISPQYPKIPPHPPPISPPIPTPILPQYICRRQRPGSKGPGPWAHGPGPMGPRGCRRAGGGWAGGGGAAPGTHGPGPMGPGPLGYRGGGWGVKGRFLRNSFCLFEFRRSAYFFLYPIKLSYSSRNAYIKKTRVRELGEAYCLLKNSKTYKS